MNKKEIKSLLRKTIKAIDTYAEDSDLMLYIYFGNDGNSCDIHNVNAYKNAYKKIIKFN